MKEIIVYRNPLEAQMWGIISNHGLEIVAFVVVFFLAFVTINHVLEKFLLYRNFKNFNRNTISKRRDIFVKISLCCGFIAGCFIVAFLNGMM